MKKKQRENNLGKILKCQEMERKAGIKEIYYITRSFLVRRAQDIRKRRKIFVKMISRKIENWRNYKGAREKERNVEEVSRKKKKFLFFFFVLINLSVLSRIRNHSPSEKTSTLYNSNSQEFFFKKSDRKKLCFFLYPE